MKKIDIHTHVFNIGIKAEDCIDRLAESCAEAEIVKCCLMAVPDYFGFSTNKDIRLAMKKYPDLMIGFGAVDMHADPPAVIDRLGKEGFRGVKFIVPPENYDDKRFYPYYEKCAQNGLLTLFHTGIVARMDCLRARDVNNNRMRPGFLDTIARAFPELTVICAHLGNPWCEEAAMSLRWNPNLYADLTGSFLKKNRPEDAAKLLWWQPNSRYCGPGGQGAWDKILFGTDVPFQEIQEVVDDHLRVMHALKLDRNAIENVFYGNAARLLKLDRELHK